jgi:hypothetical protein
MELFKLLGTIAIDTSEANEALTETVEKANDSGNEVESSFSKIGSAALGIGKAVVTAGAAVGGAWIAAIEGSREYRTEMGKLDTAFQVSGHSSEAAKQTYSDLNAVLGDSGQAVEAAQHLAKLTKNEQELQTWTDICTGVYATFGESLPIEGLTEAANETSKTGILTGGLTDALNWAGINEEKFQEKLDKCTNEQQRQKLIMDTLNGTYSEASDQYKETNKDVIASEKAQEKLTDAMAELGRIGEPILTAIKDKVGDMATAAVPHIKDFIQAIKDTITWVKENEDTIHKWVGVILGAATAIGIFLLILNWGTIMTAAVSALNKVKLAIVAMNTAILANPIAIIVALIAGLVVAFIYLWNNVEGFRKFWIDAWAKIKEIAADAGAAISKFFSLAWKNIKKAWDSTVTFFKNIWKDIKQAYADVSKWFSNLFQSAYKGILNAWSGTKKFFSDSWQSVKNTYSNVTTWFRDKFKSAWTAIKNVFSGWGSFFSGLWTQIKNKFSSIGSALGTAMGNAVKSALNWVLSTVERAINKGIGLINSAINLANKLPGVNVGKVATVSLPRLEKGGVLERGQVGLLEGTGAEAVVPLERNRAWLSQVAQDLNELQGQPKSSIDQRIYSMMNQIIELLEEMTNMKVCLESGVLVGELTPAIDRQLSDRWFHSQRGNVR